MRVFLVALALVFSSSAQAADIYLDSTTGHDENSCSQIEPCQTLGRVLDGHEAFDIIHLAPGTYDDDGVPFRISESVEITGSKQSIITAEFFIHSGAVVSFSAIKLRQVANPDDDVRSWGQRGQVTIQNASVWFTDSDADWQAGTKPLFHSVNSSLFLRARRDTVIINYAGNTSSPVIENFYDSLLWGAEWNDNTPPGYALRVIGGASQVVYSSTSRHIWLSGSIEGSGSATSHVVLASRASDGYFAPYTRVRNGVNGITLTNGSEFYAPHGLVNFPGITNDKVAQSGSRFK